MTRAGIRVLTTYELLEHILLYLPMKHLFAVQRVAVKWGDVIARSKPIRKKMFLLGEGTVLRPEGDDGREMLTHGLVRLNPLMHLYCGDDDDDLHSDHKSHAKFGSVQASILVEGQRIPQFFFANAPGTQQRGLSAHNTLVTRPPNEGFSFYNFDNKRTAVHAISRPGGIRLGDLLEAFGRAAAEHTARCGGLSMVDRVAIL